MIAYYHRALFESDHFLVFIDLSLSFLLLRSPAAFSSISGVTSRPSSNCVIRHTSRSQRPTYSTTLTSIPQPAELDVS